MIQVPYDMNCSTCFPCYSFKTSDSITIISRRLDAVAGYIYRIHCMRLALRLEVSTQSTSTGVTTPVYFSLCLKLVQA
jgi:hypothetical protein